MSEALELNEADYEAKVANETKPVLLDFWSTYCGPCRLLAPTIAALAQANADKAVVLKLKCSKGCRRAGNKQESDAQDDA